MEMFRMAYETLDDFFNFIDELLKNEELSKAFKKFVIVKLIIALKGVILTKKLYLLYHKFSL